MNIAVFGLGKLGLPLMAALASKGHEVVGVDSDEEVSRKIEAYLEKGADDLPGVEPDVLKTLLDNAERLGTDRDVETAVIVSDVVFVVVPTPSKPTGEFSTEYVMETAKTIGDAMHGEERYALIVLVSTVMPGDTAKFVDALEEHSERKCGDSFGVCYNPEFIALGSVLRDLLNPDFVLIGESDEKAGSTLERIYDSLCVTPQALTRRMNFVNAEIAKLALNCYITMKISYANLLGNLCEEIPGANAHVVTDAIGLDRRIGKEYLKPATAYGGPCFPRDVVAFSKVLGSVSFKEDTVGIPDLSDLLESVTVINSHQTQRLVDLIEKRSPQEAKVTVLGLAYKSGTYVTEESVGLDLIRLLQNRGREVAAWDPLVTKHELERRYQNYRVLQKREIDARLLADSLEDCVKDADVVVVTTPCKEFEEISNCIKQRVQSNVLIIIDPWGIVSLSSSPGVSYIQPGICYKESER